MSGHQNQTQQQTQNQQYSQQQALQNQQIDQIQYQIPENFTEQDLHRNFSREQVDYLQNQLAITRERNDISQYFDQNNQFFQSQIEFKNKFQMLRQQQEEMPQDMNIMDDNNMITQEDIINFQNFQLQNQGIQFEGEGEIDYNMLDQQYINDYQQQYNFNQQQQIQNISNQLREQNPNISMVELQNEVEKHFIQNNQILPWYTEEQAQQISSGIPNDIQLPQNLEDLVNIQNHDFALQFQRENLEKQFSQAFLQEFQNQIIPGQEQYQLNYDQNLQYQLIQQDLMKMNELQSQKGINYAQLQQQMLGNNEENQNQSQASSSIDTEKQIENEKKRDQNFRRQLRNFYKNMIENISPEVNQEIQKQQEQLCNQIDQVKRTFINEKKEEKRQKKQNQYNQVLSETSSSSSFHSSKIEQYDDADSTFQSYLYGQNSQIDPDVFIKNVMSKIGNNPEMLKWFKRFLPDDDEQDQLNMEKQYIEFHNSLNLVQGSNNEGQIDHESQDLHSKMISQLKNELFDNIMEYLREYLELKENKGIEEALELYGQKIMMLAENYLKYSASDIQNQYLIEYEKQRIALGIENDDNLDTKNEINIKIRQIYTEKLETQMQQMLQIIPQEIIDNFSLSSPVNVGGKNNYDEESFSQNQQESEKSNNQRKGLKLQKLKTNDILDMKKQQAKVLNKKDEKPKSKRLIEKQGDYYQKQKQKSDSENSITGLQESNMKKRVNKNLIKMKQKEKSEQSDESDREFEEEGSEEEDQIINEEPQNKKNKESKADNNINQINYSSDENVNANRVQLLQDRTDGQYQFQRMKPVIADLANKYNILNLNKQELTIIENLQKQIRFEDDWQSFVKIFLLYFQGVISQKDFFMLFEDKFGSRLKSDLKKEVQSLIPTRENQRRLQSEILKPWNDLENQQFIKIYDSSYYKIDADFPLPICQEKVNPKNEGHYQNFLNDKYLSLSTGSENFKFKIRNVNEDLIFKNEDEMYKLDRQIEMIKRFQDIIQAELHKYSYLTPKEKHQYKFPKHKFRVLIQYMEKKYKLLMQQTMENPFKEEVYIQLNEGLTSKMNELQNLKYDQMPQFEEVFKKNFVKSLDHRSILYNKEFIKKFLQKQQHMTEIKNAAQQNNDGSLKHINILKGGNFKDSPFYHSFGSFLKNENSLFDIGEEVSDYPIDMKFLDEVKQIQPVMIEKLPNSRMVFKDSDSVQIAIKIILLHINYSQTHHLNDRPRLIQTMKSVLVNFMQFQDFDILLKQCENQAKSSKIENIKPKQIELIMNQDQHQWYIRRCQQIAKNLIDSNEIQNCPNQPQSNVKDFQRNLRARGQGESVDKEIIQDVQPIKIEIQQNSNMMKSLLEQSDLNEINLDKESVSNKSKKDSSGTESDEEKSSQNPKNVKSQQLKQIFKLQQIKEKEYQSSEKQISDSLFLPFYDNQSNEQKHSLFYAPSNVFMFLRFFYALYERIHYSKALIKEKINQDLSEISKENKIKYGIINKETGEIEKELFENIFVKERYEHLLKGIFATTTQQGLGQVQGIAGQLQIIGHGYSHNQQIMDHNKYEDFTRQLLGKNAFLLFQIYKIVSQTIKQVAQMYSDQSYKEALKLYENLNSDFQNKNSNCKINEMTYLQNYTQQIVDQFQLSDYQDQNQGSSGKQFTKNQSECQHTSNIFEKNKYNLDQSSKQDIQNPSNQAAQYSNALNSASAIQQQNFQFFRLLWSNQSKIMSIHYININPNLSQVLTGRNFFKIMQDNYNIMANSTVQPIKIITNQKNEIDCKCETNKLKDSNSNIFLRRNLKKMNQYRKKDDISKKCEMKNGITLRFLSNQNHMAYDVQGEDIFLWKGEKGKGKDVKIRKSKLKVNDYILQDFQRQCRAGEIRAKRLKTLES